MRMHVIASFSFNIGRKLSRLEKQFLKDVVVRQLKEKGAEKISVKVKEKRG